MAPALVAMAVIVFYPLVQAFVWTVTDIDRSNQGTIFKEPSWEFIGLENYVTVLQDPLFAHALWWTIIWTVVNVFFHYVFGLLLAVVLNQKLRGRTGFRLMLLVPWAIPIYISAIGWSFIFNGEYGLLNNVLAALPGDFTRVAWYSEFPWYYIMPIIVNVWAGIPFMMVALLGGLQGIPQDQYEAAKVDGASRWQSFWNITMPGLRTVSTTVILLGCIWTFNLFAVIFFTTNGGPAGKTEILVTYAFRVFNRGDYALAATYGVIIFSILIVFSLLYRRLSPDSQ